MAVVAKSVLHNLGVVLVAMGFAYLGTIADGYLGFVRFHSSYATVPGWVLLSAGFLLRVWATQHFYERHMRVISLEPQGALVTTGPFRFTRNPLYLGGNVFAFLGAGLLLGSPTMLAATVLHLPLMDRMIRREENQLAEAFGDQWARYVASVRRWL
jgi:protein-S-isoprenylcysteine O-methyltransferase Ste14